MKILVDHREGQIKSALEEIFDEVEFDLLPFGDIAILFDDYAVILERKSIHDFINSIRSNRLWEQLLKMVKAKEIRGVKIKRKLLLVHGSILDFLGMEDFYNEKLWASISGALMEIVYVYGIPIFFLENNDAVITFIRILCSREMKGANDSLPKARWFRKAFKELPEKDMKVYLLSSLPNVGEVLARNLLNHFGSISRIANAGIEELKLVEGIGNKRARQIYELFH